MDQYIVIAHDFADGQALERRMAARPFHFNRARELKMQNRFIKGGAILNEDGKMIGSVMMMQFENNEELENWKKNEPYIIQGVWERWRSGRSKSRMCELRRDWRLVDRDW